MVYWLFLLWLAQLLLLIQSRPTDVGITHNGWDLLHQLAVKKCPIDISQANPIERGSLFLGGSSLCQIGKKKKPSQHRDERGKVRRCLKGEVSGTPRGDRIRTRKPKKWEKSF